ncbi:sensor histidine kinase [Nocardioides insulae]|uniref:sensor histidine kinase n=1 Tax=Nocardioides insulae TaxID=394734 RepID=UPI001FDF8422|nr:HAMP domain-containing sensor histidine kinase [Nocardioides insulae]
MTTGTTDPQPAAAGGPKRGLTVRTRIAATMAVIVAATLIGAGLIVYLVEADRIEASVQQEMEQELDEFAKLQQGVDPQTGEAWTDVDALLFTFLQRNVPDDDELLVAWVGNGPEHWFPDDELVHDPAFLEAAEPLVAQGGTTRFDSDWGKIVMTSQPVAQGETTGALLVVGYLDEDLAELQTTMRTYAVVALLCLIVVVLVAYLQSGWLLRPLRTLQQTAEEISATDLSRRIPETGNDDLTALTHTVNGMLDRLDTSFQSQRRFLDDAGHELRTPLTVISGHLELLDPHDPAEVRATRDLVLEEVDRMSRLVRDLILLTKSARPGFLTVDAVDAAALTRGVLTKATALGSRSWVIDEVAPVVVLADSQRLTQAMLQLTENAVKHTTEGDTIALGSAYGRGRLTLWVRDTGPGIPAAQRDQVFERFGRADVPHGDDGFGLGLSIVRAIVAAHGGTVRVEEADPPGALVVLDLPAPEAGHDPGHPDPPRSPAGPTRKEHPWPTS